MTREDRFEEKAREVYRSLWANEQSSVPVIAAALRQAADEALERAAQEILIAFDNACWDGLAERVRTGKWTREASHV